MNRLALALCFSACLLAVNLSRQVFACSSHGTMGGPPVTLRADVFGDTDGDGLLNGRLGIVDRLIAPTSTANCVAGVGIGNFGLTIPRGMLVTGAQIAVVNQRTGAATPLPDFTFAANSTTTAGMVAGGNGIDPLFDGSAWFGFSSRVNPFTLPPLGTDEAFELLFDVELPPEALPLSIPVQFAAGQGDALGAPIFTGGHPVGYFTALDSTARFAVVPEPASAALWLIAAALLLAAGARSKFARSVSRF